jgi:serine protease Do
MRKLLILVVILIILLGLIVAGSTYFPQLNQLLGTKEQVTPTNGGKVKVLSEESVVINVVKNVGPSVVTIAATNTQQNSPFDQNGPFSFFGMPVPQQPQDNNSNEPQNIGSGFIVTKDGFIVTNKHVVSDTNLKYVVISNNGKKYDAQKIYRDPINDIAIIQINPAQNLGNALKPVEMGDSSDLQVGQMAIAIGTALGEFSNTVTTGVISGLGRGITAGSPFEGTSEQLENVIQTDAAINPGNSGGPLLNSSGQVIGMNTAVSESGQNIGFALPINTIKDSIKNFNQNGQFNRPYLGVAYRMLSRDLAIANDLPEGAYIQTVVSGSAAEQAGLQEGDIITKVDGQKLQAGSNELSTVIAKHKVGDTLALTVYHEDENNKGSTHDVKVTLQSAPQQ